MVEDGEVAVVVVGQARPGRVDPVVSTEDIRIGGHPGPDGLGAGVDPVVVGWVEEGERGVELTGPPLWPGG